MTTVFIASLAVACVLSAVESLILSIGKWRGLLALILSVPFCLLLGSSLQVLLVYSLAATFLGLTMSIVVEQTFTGISVREFRGLPQKVDKI